MILNWVWLGFILCAIAAALVQTLGGDAAALPRLMSALPTCSAWTTPPRRWA